MPTTILDKIKRTILTQPIADAADLDGETVFSVTKTSDDKLKVKKQNAAREATEEELNFVPSHVRTELYSGDIDITATAPTVDVPVSTWVDYDDIEIVIDIGAVGSAQAIYGPLNVFRLSKALLQSLQEHAGNVEFPNYARRIGSATEFGISETIPQGLASDGTNLYMVGVHTKRRYNLDPTTGVASQPGPNHFGLGAVGSPRALAWHNSILYLVESFGGLHTLNAAGSATLVGNLGMSGLAGLGTTLYGVVGGPGSHIRLFSVNTSDASKTSIGSALDFGVGEKSPRGLASDGINLYMVGQTNKKIYTVDTTTGVATPLSGAVNFLLGSDVTVTPTALAVHNGAFYMLDDTANALYKVAKNYSAAVIPLQVVTEGGERAMLSLARRSDNTLALAGTLPAADARSLKIFGIRYRVV